MQGPLDVATLTEAMAAVGLGELMILTSRVADRGEYLWRDFGGWPRDLGSLDSMPRDRTSGLC